MRRRLATLLSIPLLAAACGEDSSATEDAASSSTGGSAGPGTSPSTDDQTSASATTGGSSEGADTESSTDAENSSETGSTGGDDPPPSSGWYPGIPYPTDDLPAGIMPTLPEPNAQPGWPYDPITLELPRLGSGDNVYVASVAGDDGTAGNGGNGSVDAPRRTLPTGDLGTSAHLYIIGDDSAYGTVDFDIGDDDTWTCTGSVDAPCFIVGIGTPRIGRRIALTNAEHVVVDGLSFVDTPSGDRPWGAFNINSSRYVTVRNTEIRGDGSSSSGGSAMSIQGVEFLFSYRMRFHELGSWESNPQDRDVHGWRPQYSNRYLWLIDSELFHLQGDGVQTGNSNNQGSQDETSHYIYIAGNEFYENYENSVDNKNSYHVVISGNEIHDFFASEGVGANSTAMILSNNSEGPWTGYHWALGNHVYDSGLAIRDSGSETDELNFAIGNVVHNVSTAFLQANNDPGREFWVVHNSVYGAQLNLDAFQPGNGSSLTVEGNIFHGGEIDTLGEIDSTLRNNILFGVEVSGSWDVEDGNLDQDPMFADPDSGDLSLSEASPGIDVFDTESAVFGLFEDLYGLDIRTDIAGTSRPAGQGWDLGAIEQP
ncbi:MAG: hypothetical protein ACRBN8_12890 [Nannocystales bacterium]